MEFWNNVEILRKTAATFQWFAIVLVFLGGLLQIAQVVIDRREKSLSQIIDSEKESIQAERLRIAEASAEDTQKAAESLRKELADNSGVQSEMDRAANALAQARVGLRQGLEELIRLKDSSPSKQVRERATVLFDSVSADYERFVKDRMQEDGAKNAIDALKYNDLGVTAESPNLISGLVKVLRTEKELYQVTYAFLALREATKHELQVFDFAAIEEWCARHNAECTKK